MKITDMTDTVFDREMQRILGDVMFWITRLDQVGDFNLEPTPVSYADGSGQQPFPLAIDLKEVWDYARGTGKRPEGMQDIIQSLTELLWAPVGGTSYSIPSTWWDEPLGIMCRLAWARQALDTGDNLTVEQLSLLSGMSIPRIKQLCQTGKIPAVKVQQGRSNRKEWSIPADAAQVWLKSRE